MKTTATSRLYYSQYVHDSSSLTWPESNLLAFFPILDTSTIGRMSPANSHCTTNTSQIYVLHFCTFWSGRHILCHYSREKLQLPWHHAVWAVLSVTRFPASAADYFLICRFENLLISWIELLALMFTWNYTFIHKSNPVMKNRALLMSRAVLSFPYSIRRLILAFCFIDQ